MQWIWFHFSELVDLNSQTRSIAKSEKTVIINQRKQKQKLQLHPNTWKRTMLMKLMLMLKLRNSQICPNQPRFQKLFALSVDSCLKTYTRLKFTLKMFTTTRVLHKASTLGTLSSAMEMKLSVNAHIVTFLEQEAPLRTTFQRSMGMSSYVGNVETHFQIQKHAKTTSKQLIWFHRSVSHSHVIGVDLS